MKKAHEIVRGSKALKVMSYRELLSCTLKSIYRLIKLSEISDKLAKTDMALDCQFLSNMIGLMSDKKKPYDVQAVEVYRGLGDTIREKLLAIYDDLPNVLNGIRDLIIFNDKYFKKEGL